MDTKKVAKVAKVANIYICTFCDYSTERKSNIDKHNLTAKHLKMMDDTKMIQTDTKKVAKVAKNQSFTCKCGKTYVHKQNIYRHRKQCYADDAVILNKFENDQLNYKEMFIEMVNQNKTLQNTIAELIPKVGNNTIHSNINNNTIRQKFNIKIFLNDMCKDAISLGEFIKTVEVSVTDLLLTKDKGLAEGISNLFVEHLNKIPLTRRPLWCTDKKRKRLFIKNEEWIEDEDHLNTKAAIKQVSVLQSKNINKYLTDKPNWMSNDKEKETYLEIVKKSTDPIEDKTDKILDILIDKIHLTDDRREKLLSL